MGLPVRQKGKRKVATQFEELHFRRDIMYIKSVFVIHTLDRVDNNKMDGPNHESHSPLDGITSKAVQIEK